MLSLTLFEDEPPYSSNKSPSTMIPRQAPAQELQADFVGDNSNFMRPAKLQSEYLPRYW